MGYYKLYTLLTILFHPIISLYLRYRLYKGKEDKERFGERLGYSSIARPKGKLIWIHCASVGESISVLPLISRLKENILITTGTITSAKLLKDKLPQNAIHQYIPVDRVGGVNRFLNHWQPDLAVWVESELWPHLVLKAKCPMILLNGRMSDDSYKKWKRFEPFINQLLQKFSVILPQSKNEKFEDLGAENVKYIGNIKYSAPPLGYDERELAKLQNEIGERKVWLVASTHSGEEEIIKIAQAIIKKKYSDALTIIVPRHPNRAGDILKIFPEATLRSQVLSISSNVYIADTMGEMGLFYQLADIAFIGGSLIPHGGHNPLEPAKLNCAVIYGQYIDNFKEIYNELEDATIKVNNAEELASAVIKLFDDEEYRQNLNKKAYEIAMSKMDIWDEVKQEIENLL